MSRFIKISDEKQLNEFMKDVWSFHDGVISKASYISGSRGNKSESCPSDINPRFVLRIEGCNYKQTTIDGVELLFEGVTRVCISPTEENYTSEIWGTKIVKKNNKFIFVSDIDADIDQISTDETGYCYVMAERLSYRFI